MRHYPYHLLRANSLYAQIFLTKETCKLLGVTQEGLKGAGTAAPFAGICSGVRCKVRRKYDPPRISGSTAWSCQSPPKF